MGEKIRDDPAIRSAEFGYDPSRIWYRKQQHLQTIGGVYMGIQAVVRLEGTSYQVAFDKALKRLKRFADKGARDFGWRSPTDKSKWGQYNEIILSSGHKYLVVDRTERGDKGITLTVEAEGKEQGGTYYFTGKGRYSVREIDIHGGESGMKNVDQAMKEIKSILASILRRCI